MGPHGQVTKGSGRDKFMWGKEKQRAFDDLKHHLFSSIVLSLSDLQQPFDIDIDASDYVVGAFLTHHGHLVTYHSEKLFDTIQKYPTYDKKMHSIVQASHQWKHYILGKEMIIHTNHKPLQFIQTHEKLQNELHQKWSTYL
jgi:hypothetical protein